MRLHLLILISRSWGYCSLRFAILQGYEDALPMSKYCIPGTGDPGQGCLPPISLRLCWETPLHVAVPDSTTTGQLTFLHRVRSHVCLIHSWKWIFTSITFHQSMLRLEHPNALVLRGRCPPAATCKAFKVFPLGMFFNVGSTSSF